MEVRLLERPGCGLCDEAAAALARIGRRRPLRVTRVDIGDDPAYLLRLPVLAVGEEEYEAAGMADAAIDRWLDEVATV